MEVVINPLKGIIIDDEEKELADHFATIGLGIHNYYD